MLLIFQEKQEISLSYCVQYLNIEARKKISLFCNVREEYVIHQKDVKNTVYEVPLMLVRQNVDEKIFSLLTLYNSKALTGRVKTLLQND